MNNLANELRPQTLEDVIGQKNTINLLKKIVEHKLSTSFIFFGESGTGKTSTAVALANDMQKSYGMFNASIGSKNELIDLLKSKEIIIIDEIHRLNKDKQDILLSYLEYDKVIVYATTTENPYFRVNPAVRSRMQILQFTKLDEKDVAESLRKVIDKHFPDLIIQDDVLLSLIKHSNGDYRNSLNNLQMVALLNRNKEVKNEDLKKLIPNINFYSDMNSSAHYNNLSAFHKSLRGSDVDAALYYGTLILKSGDYQGLFRRLTCVAYEDIGLADPNVSLRVEAAFNAVEKLGFPEANLPIYFAIITTSLAPKSNSVYMALNKVQNFIDQGNVYEIPKHLRDSHYSSASKLGDGLGYLYPHDFPNSIVKQSYLPTKIKDQTFLEFHDNDSPKIKEYYELIKKINRSKNE
ncbi:replication-associated recombination protein A [Mycoplasmopsis iners]|uniref:replication-associated recombination protein A n=1 Tax=Mycoplasmopsis iners TaxID=76630 RepID=UPI0004962DA1|nr:replication-associated recombination protein A [Mycoplasmopsis iners]